MANEPQKKWSGWSGEVKVLETFQSKPRSKRVDQMNYALEGRSNDLPALQLCSVVMEQTTEQTMEHFGSTD